MTAILAVTPEIPDDLRGVHDLLTQLGVLSTELTNTQQPDGHGNHSRPAVAVPHVLGYGDDEADDSDADEDDRHVDANGGDALGGHDGDHIDSILCGMGWEGAKPQNSEVQYVHYIIKY